MNATSHRSRRLLVRLDRGGDLLRGIAEACTDAEVRSGQLQGSGWLEQVELSDYDPVAKALRPPRRLQGPLQLLHLHGTIGERDGALSVSARATLSREADSGPQVLGGQVLGGRALLVELVVEAYEDLIARRGVDERTGLEGWIDLIEAPAEDPEPASAKAAPATVTAPPAPAPVRVAPAPVAAAPAPVPVKAAPATVAASPAPAPVKAPPAPASAPAKSVAPTSAFAAGTSTQVRPAQPAAPRPAAPPAAEEAAPSPSLDWAAVQRASESQQGDEGDEPPRRGDLLDHPTFGRCMIERYEEERDRISVRHRGKLIELSLERLQVSPVGREGQNRLFRATIRR